MSYVYDMMFMFAQSACIRHSVLTRVKTHKTDSKLGDKSVTMPRDLTETHQERTSSNSSFQFLSVQGSICSYLKSQPQLSFKVKTLFFKHQTKSSSYRHIWMDPYSNEHLPLARQWKCNSWMPQNAVPSAGRQNGRMVVSMEVVLL